MKVEVVQINGVDVAIVDSNKVLIRDVQSALDFMGDLVYRGINKIIIHESNIVADFFDLKTGIAGEILQKFSTYQVRLAIIGDFTKFYSKSLKDFIFESNKMGHILFIDSIEVAKQKIVL